MLKPSKHPEEERRIAELQSYNILDSLPEKDYDDLVRIAASVCDTPIALISLVDNERQWFKSAIGLGDTTETPRDVSVCAHAILDPKFNGLVSLDLANDERFTDNPLVNGEAESLQFYAGANIIGADEGMPLGTICVADRVRRDAFTPEQQMTLTALSRQVANLLELRRRKAQLTEANQHLAEIAATDPLTGLANRRTVDARLSEEALRAARSGNPLSVLAIDIDHFKRLNDTHGHAAGDLVLKEFSALLFSACRSGSGDTAGRIGGEEFVAILPETDLKESASLAERLCLSVAKNIFAVESITISIGAAQLAVGQSPTELLAAADRALYRAKAEGRNRVSY